MLVRQQWLDLRMVQKLAHELGKHLAALQSIAVLREHGRVPDRVVGREVFQQTARWHPHVNEPRTQCLKDESWSIRFWQFPVNRRAPYDAVLSGIACCDRTHRRTTRRYLATAGHAESLC